MGNFIPSLLPGCSLTTPLSSGHRAEVGSCSTSISQPLDHVTPPWLCELREVYFLHFEACSASSACSTNSAYVTRFEHRTMQLINCELLAQWKQIWDSLSVCGSSVSSGMWMILMDDVSLTNVCGIFFEGTRENRWYCMHLESWTHFHVAHFCQGWEAKNSGNVPCFYSKTFIFARLNGICAESIQTENKCSELFLHSLISKESINAWYVCCFKVEFLCTQDFRNEYAYSAAITACEKSTLPTTLV